MTIGTDLVISPKSAPGCDMKLVSAEEHSEPLIHAPLKSTILLRQPAASAYGHEGDCRLDAKLELEVCISQCPLRKFRSLGPSEDESKVAGALW